MRVQVFSNTPDVIFGQVGRVFVMICRDKIEMQRVGDLPLFRDRLDACAAEGIAIVTIVEKKSGPPDGEVRKVMAAILKEHSDNIRCCAVVVEGTGFQSALARSVTIGLTMIARTPFPYEVVKCQHLDGFLKQHLKPKAPRFSEEFREGLAQLREGAVPA